MLEELGYKVCTAQERRGSAGTVCSRKFDLMVTDYKMPNMDGIELIQEDPQYPIPTCRIIMLSGFVEPLGLDEKSTGADVVIAKSSGEVGNLVRSVSRLLSRRVDEKTAGLAESSPQKSKATERVMLPTV